MIGDGGVEQRGDRYIGRERGVASRGRDIMDNGRSLSGLGPHDSTLEWAGSGDHRCRKFETRRRRSRRTDDGRKKKGHGNMRARKKVPGKGIGWEGGWLKTETPILPDMGQTVGRAGGRATGERTRGLEEGMVKKEQERKRQARQARVSRNEWQRPGKGPC
jgi:hypothetical protein